MTSKELFSEKLVKGNRTYFFDIKKSVKGDLYLKIGESKKNNNGFEHHSLMVFDEDLKDFVENFQKTLEVFKELKEPVKKSVKTYSFEEVRKTHQQAYMPWTKEDDLKLEQLFCEGAKTKELAEIFQRNQGAINSRINKLELKEKYNY